MMEAKTTRSGGDPGQQQPPPGDHHETAQEDAVASWSNLCPELIGRVGTFLPVVDDRSSSTQNDNLATENAASPGDSDVMNLMLSVGPGTAAVIRKTYLQNNYQYFLECLISTTAENGASEWLNHNEVEWKKRCHGLKSGSHVHSVSLKPEQIQMIELKILDVAIFCSLPLDSFISILRTSCDSEDLNVPVLDVLTEFPSGLVLIGAGSTDLDPGMSAAEVKSALEKEAPGKDGRVVLRFMLFIDYVFVSPVLVIRFGLMNVLRYMIDEAIIEINDTFPGGPRGRPLICHAADLRDSMFAYLLACQGIDVNVRVDESRRLIHYCIVRDHISASMLEVLLQHPNIELDALKEDGRTALFIACCILNVAKAKLLLERGADPYIVTGTGISAIGILRSVCSRRRKEKPPKNSFH